uniref:Uncharacterized protein n=1 Tax=Glossina austeni TaxID=7395 RepID=A0A1A9UT85_GLOAU
MQSIVSNSIGKQPRYFESTMPMQKARKGFLIPKQNKARSGLSGCCLQIRGRCGCFCVSGRCDSLKSLQLAVLPEYNLSSSNDAPIQPVPLLLPARLGEPPLVQSSVPELTTKPTPNPSYCVLFSPVMSQLQLLLLLQLLQ